MKSIRIGRSPDNDIVINDPTVSRNHLVITQEYNGTYTVKDLNSANGTTVNGSRVFGSMVIRPGDIVVAGSARPLPWMNYFNGTSGGGGYATSYGNMPPVSSAPSATYSSGVKQSLPNATGVLVLGICSLVFSCAVVGVVLGIIGLALSSNGRQLHRNNPNQYEGYGRLNAGYIMSIIGTILGGLYLIYIIIWMVILGQAIAYWPYDF
jgi:hypothetical protein